MSELREARSKLTRTGIVALSIVLLVAAIFRFGIAADNDGINASADERSYISLSVRLAETNHYGVKSKSFPRKASDPWRWSPGTPLIYAAVAKVFPPSSSDIEKNQFPAAYWLNAVLGLLAVVAAFTLVLLFTNQWFALAAASLVAFHPSLIRYTNHPASENVAVFTTLISALTLCLTWRSKPVWMVLSGAVLGFAVLVRPDLLLVVPTLALLLLIVHRKQRLQALKYGVALTVGALLAIGPWSAYVSRQNQRFVPITTGGGPALFIGTYLPGKGATIPTKRAFSDEIVRKFPKYRGKEASELPPIGLLSVIAERHPDVPRESALRKEGVNNLKKYALGQPIDFSAMMVDKIGRMWLKASRPGHWWPPGYIDPLHSLVVLLALLFTLSGLVISRSGRLAALFTVVLVPTLFHSIVIAHARYAAPLYPVLVVCGAIGCAVTVQWYLRRRRPVVEDSQVI